MTALNDAERAAIRRDAEGGANRAAPVHVEHTAVEQTGRDPAWLRSRRFFAAVIAIGGMQLLATMDSTVAIVALPKIQDELSLSDAGRSWVITAYVLTFGGLILLGGRLGDTIGRKRTFIVGVALFTIASVLCSIAWNDATLVIARLLQGVGAAIASPTGLALIATTFPKGPGRNAATAVFGAMTGVGSVMGLVVGGALAELSWRFAFLVNLPIGVRRSRSWGKQRVQHRSWRNEPVVRQRDPILRERLGVRERHREPLGRPAKMHQLRHG